MRAECEQFGDGTRLQDICNGTAGLPLHKINAYRDRFGLDPLSESEYAPRALPATPNVTRHTAASRQRPRRNGAVISISRPAAGLPGLELKRIFTSKGIPPCQACDELAQQMNAWGIEGCQERIDDIVEDIVPRAVEWMAEHRPWVHALLPKAIEAAGVRQTLRGYVTDAISAAAVKRDEAQRQETRRAKGCCGKSSRSFSRPRTEKPNDVSNLILSTAHGPSMDRIETPRKTVTTIPFVNLTANLLYHVYPREGSAWQWNLDQLMQRIDLFNGRKIVAIAIDDKTASADDVRKYLGRNVHEYLVYRNEKAASEMVSFVSLLRQLITDDPDQITFRAHAKGVVQQTKAAPHILDWVEMLYRTNLDDFETVQRHLESHALTGACRKFGQFSRKSSDATYSGTFYWFRNCWVYSRTWDKVNPQRWGCEEWPARLFRRSETECLFLDNTGSMYSERYWRETVVPQYEQWKREHTA